ncbi:FUSC family protein [Nakamurella deserti]|uniref:FUSC family protein n=1 Tax=Nakamurella deserti TaxID=2164074 RepID=UPI001478CA17|nr:FUSC family protein [Nakamurella deserti]
MTSPVDQARTRVRAGVGAGLDRVVQEVRDARDRFVASDPGRARQRIAVRVFVAVGSTLLVEWALAALLRQPPRLLILFGGVLAMLLATGVKDAGRRGAAVTVLIGTGLALLSASIGVLIAPHHLASLIGFVSISFLAVWLRRFGPRWFALGFVFWQSYFFTLFLQAPRSELPVLWVALLVAAGWVGLLLVTVLHPDPRRTLDRTVVALRARARAAISAALDVLDEPDNARTLRRLRRQLVQVDEVALLLDGQLAEPRALPAGVPPGRLRRWTVDVQIGLDAVCGAVRDIAARRDALPAAAVGDVRAVLTALGWGDRAGADRVAHALAAPDGRDVPALRRLGSAALFLLDTVGAWDSGALTDPARTDGSPDPLDVEEDDFEPAVTLVGGALPGSASLAERSLDQPDAARFAPSRWRLTTRQAVQAAVAAALAIVAGELISPQRFYWAVIAAFVAFAGAATSGETVSKSASRILGTVLGLFGAVALGEVTRGHPVWAALAVLVCIAAAFFVQVVSNSAMVFFFTVMLGQLYTLLGTFSDRVLILRLEETAVGALIGIGVSLLVLPTHSRATLRVARQTFFTALADLLDACGTTLRGEPVDRSALTLTVLVEDAGRQVVRARKALTRGRLFGANRLELRHRVSVLGACGAAARALAAAILDRGPDPALAAVCAELAEAARELAAAPTLRGTTPPGDGEARPGDGVRVLLDAVASATDGRRDPAYRAAARLNEALELLGPRSARETVPSS